MTACVWLQRRGAAIATIAALAIPPGAGAQTPDSVTQAAAVIAPVEVTRHLDVLTADSMRSRPAPGPALERTAQYVATEFQRLGLRPGATEHGRPSWLQRYPVPGQQRLKAAESHLILLTRPQPGGKPFVTEWGYPVKRELELTLATTPAYFTPDVGPQTLAHNAISMAQIFSDPLRAGLPLAVVAGRQSAAAVRRMAETLRESAVAYLPDAGADAATRHEIITALYAISPAVLVVSDEDSVEFARTAAAGQLPVMMDRYLQRGAGPRRWPWAITIWAPVVRDFLGTAGVDLAALRADTVPVARRLPFAAVFFETAGEAATSAPVTAPNAVGVLEGSDPRLRQQYVVVAARMDTDAGGVDVRDADSSSHGDLRRDGEAPGLAALLAVARAFTAPGARPRRSVIFLATSGGARESWGANFFAENDKTMMSSRYPPVVASFTLDMRGRATGDSLWVDGLRDIELAVSPAWLAAAHSELGLGVADGGTAVRPVAGHFPFVRRTVPSLYLHAAEAADTAGPPVVDATDVVRVARFVFYLSRATATADARPRWSVEGRQHLSTVLGP